ncbi:MAG: DUF4625 domain-containing protein [Rikenellaceae bacterium]
MKLRVFFAAAVAVVLASIFVACDEAGDTEKPVIDLVSPAEGEAVAADGTGMHFEMNIEDNEGLGSYKVEIHSNFDDHAHASSALLNTIETKSDDESTTEETVDFTFNQSWSEDISGKLNTYVHHHEIVIPTNATHGDYHFIVYCTDAAGNESYVVRNITIGEDSDHDHDEE